MIPNQEEYISLATQKRDGSLVVFKKLSFCKIQKTTIK